MINNTSFSKEAVEYLHINNLIDDKSDIYAGIVDHYQIDRIIVEIMALGMRKMKLRAQINYDLL